ncbi:endonuclease/exonuclease/phosphatase family protein [Angustibacter peucedani]
MTYNVRVDTGSTRTSDVDRWGSRAPLLVSLLRSAPMPHVLAVQEALSHQLDVVRSALGPGFAVVGEGRDADGGGEHTVLLVDTSVVTVVEHGQWWVSATPSVPGSIADGTTYPRVVTWARLAPVGDGPEVVAVAVHLDHESEDARLLGADQVAALAASSDVPVLVMGDLNAPAGSAVWQRLAAAGLRDAVEEAAVRTSPDVGTFPDYGEPVVGGDRIDAVLVSAGLDVLEAGADRWSAPDGRRPSDHLPVRALLA